MSSVYDAHDALLECGVEMGDKESTVQIPCPLPGHGPDNKPSARYYSASGSGPAHFYCFKCRVNLNGIGLFAKVRGMEFMRALSELERRFGIRVPPKPDVQVNALADRGQVSEAWGDVPRMLSHLENKLKRVRNRVSMLEYVKWCRVVDAVRWDLDMNGGIQSPDMVGVLVKLKDIMDKAGNEII